MIPVDWKSLFEPVHARTGFAGPDHAASIRNTRVVRIDWSDCDPAGIIFYPRYFNIFDACTTALFERVLGMTKFELLKHFEFSDFPLERTRARFLRPTRYGDDVTVDSKMVVGDASFEIEHRLSLKGEICVECSEKRQWVVRGANGSFQSSAVPDEVIKKFRMI